ncbi:CPBP family intramembrane glutamic endopeptidase [Altericroceibacterium xinjiangense]|uniref:CPBP family intramembrane glutamic endopeptidase n=1 Tax=Altericroceibacterium xinjiangense TaxID=762261 RepID=UPI0019D104A2|nr:type II CAAX endopeptidase family protein [Altericroceibacterium xinjiangense]
MPIALGRLRVLKPGRLRWLRALAWMIALFFICIATFGASMEIIQQLIPKSELGLRFLGHCIGVLIMLGIYSLLVRLGEARWPTELAIRPAPFEPFSGAVIGAAMFTVVMAVLAGCGLYHVTYTGPASAWAAAGKAIEAGVVEELAVRGIMLRLLWRAFGPGPAFLVSALAFGGSHLFNPESSLLAAICVMLEAGIMLGAFYALTGRLWMSIGVHAAWNFTQGYLFGAAVSGTELGPAIARSVPSPDLPSWLSGGAFGPEASLPALVVCTAVGAAVLWRAWTLGMLRSHSDTNEPRALAPSLSQPATACV